MEAVEAEEQRGEGENAHQRPPPPRSGPGYFRALDLTADPER
jgi:hypothetical protein